MCSPLIGGPYNGSLASEDRIAIQQKHGDLVSVYELIEGEFFYAGSCKDGQDLPLWPGSPANLRKRELRGKHVIGINHPRERGE